MQRGFFLDLESQHRLDIEDVPFEVRFPKLPGFEVRRANATYVPWPIEEPTVMALMHWIDSVTAVHKTISPEILAELDTRGSTPVPQMTPSFNDPPVPQRRFNWVARFYDLQETRTY